MTGNLDLLNQSKRASAPAILHIHLLGSFRLQYREEMLNTLNTTRWQAILAYLVLHREALISRQHVAFLFWPESTKAQALFDQSFEILRAHPEPGIFTVVWTLGWLMNLAQAVSFALIDRTSQTARIERS